MAGDSSKNSPKQLHDLKKRRKSSKEKSLSDQQYEKVLLVLDKYEKLDEEESGEESDGRSDKTSDEEKESDEGSDKTIDEDDEEKESDGEDAEDYYWIEKSDTDGDDAVQDYNPYEVYHERWNDDIPLELHANNILLQPFDDGVYLNSGAIVSSDGSYLYVTPAFPQVSREEIDMIWRAFDLPGSSEVYLGGKKIKVIQVEPGLLQQKKEEGGGVAVMRTQNTLVFGLYEEPATQLRCNERVKKMARFLVDLGM